MWYAFFVEFIEPTIRSVEGKEERWSMLCIVPKKDVLILLIPLRN